MDLQYDMNLSIAVGGSRTSTDWKNKNTSWAKLAEKCSHTKTTSETMAEYMKMNRDQQGRVKDVGGFVGGTLAANGRRKKENILNRQIITLDADSINEGCDLWEDFCENYNCAALAYGTHKYTKEKPRLRLLIPLSHTVNTEQWEAISRRVAETLGMCNFDKTTFDSIRLMYWPSTPKGIEYYFRLQDAPILEPEAILNKYEDWRDVSTWPRHKDEDTEKVLNNARKAPDPKTKSGIIGLFCRAYTINEAIEEFLPNIYTPTRIANRYTYKNGSTYGGLLTFNDGYAFSMHSTDPANLNGHGCNAFDLVRIHMFGAHDTDSKPDTPANKLPSFLEMEKFCLQDKRIKRLRYKEKAQEIKADFGDIGNDDQEVEDDDWKEKLTYDKRLHIEKTTNNLCILLLHDPKLKKIRFDRFCKDDVTFCEDFENEKGNKIEDESAGKIALYFERCYDLPINQNKVFDLLKMTSTERGFNPVHEFIHKQEWDGVQRLETVIINYLGAEDTQLNRAVTKIWFVAAIARAYNPGVKFDYVLTLPGPQGIGKSTFLHAIAGNWFSDSFSFADKDNKKVEAVSAGWIIEISELNGLKRANDAEAAKAFLSKRVDLMRPAYGHKVEEFPRHSVFAATTNKEYFLPGENGDRRWWIIPVSGKGPLSSWLDKLKRDVPQLWAEAYKYYQDGIDLFLSPELEEEARLNQAKHDVAAGDDLKEQIQAFLDRLLPINWETMGKTERKAWMAHNDPLDADGIVPRTKVCAAEIKEELPADSIRRYSSQRINKILDNCEGWQRNRQKMDFGPLYGRQSTPYIRQSSNEQENDI